MQFSFCFFICDHNIQIKETFPAVLPVLIYATLYFIMVVVIGEEHGGWNDFYGFATRVPVWIPMIAIMPLTFAIASVLRLLHNKCCLNRKERAIKLFREIGAAEDLGRVVEIMARARKKKTQTADIMVPARMIQYLIEDNESNMTLEEGCRRYLSVFFEEDLKSSEESV